MFLVNQEVDHLPVSPTPDSILQEEAVSGSVSLMKELKLLVDGKLDREPCRPQESSLHALLPIANRRFPPSLSSQLLWSISAEFNATVDLKGIDVYRFTLPDNALAAPVSNPDNQCYCTNQVITKNCTVAGVLDISSCRGFPVYISLPHFLHANTDLQQGVVGLNPNQEEHNIFLDVEPITGFTLRFSKRLQLNMVYGPSEDILILNQIRKLTFMPLLWLNETAVLDDETADMFKKELISQIDLLEGFQIGLLVIGSAIFVGCIIGLIVVCSKPDKPRMV
ncbi:hypothetical protein DNTS_033216 [Danionella cerebrum]|uniref:Platelet glycoprotein 4 n=1 Tax=Danionella cerebrum TaxID=2873325 RepID=A0A553RCV0_9TELE|nr:hypothetical protein DNTS_033216 [Danionella translucida]